MPAWSPSVTSWCSSPWVTGCSTAATSPESGAVRQSLPLRLFGEAALVAVHAFISGGWERFERLTVLAKVADAEAGVEMDGDVPDADRPVYRRAQPAGHGAGRFPVAGIEQNGELIAAQAGHRFAWAQAVAQALGDDAQHLVTRLVPVAVVHLLEPVQVQVDHGHAAVALAVAPEMRLEQAAVADAREVIHAHHAHRLDQH